jgi:hypothetical protein
MFRAVLLAAMLVALLAMGGCGLLVRKGVESATGVKVDQGTGQVTVTGKDGGTATIQQGKLPAGMPSDFPVYQGAVKFGNKVATSQGTTYQIVIETADSAETIGNWYETKLKAAGWKIDARNDVTTNGKAITTISAKSGTSQAMIIGGQGADTTQNSVNITLTTK